MVEIGLAEYFGMGEALGIIGTFFVVLYFSTEHKNMLSHLYQKMNKPMVAISRGKIDNVPLGQEFYKLEIALRSAQAKEYSLDKEETSYDDMLDALRLACLGYTNLN